MDEGVEDNFQRLTLSICFHRNKRGSNHNEKDPNGHDCSEKIAKFFFFYFI